MNGQPHRYFATCVWEGSTGVGYEAYDRTHRAASPPVDDGMILSSAPAFRGDAQVRNPEQLLIMAAASCQLLAFLAVAARARIDVVGYADDAEGVMPRDDVPQRITEIRLRPRITVRPPTTEERVRHLTAVAHEGCFIANSLRTEIIVDPVVVVTD